MEIKFQKCDRCSKPKYSEKESANEIILNLFIENRNGTDTKEKISADLCEDCYNDLVKWFVSNESIYG